MRYWWANQNQTYRQEIAGGYLWSPQRKRDGSRNAFYESMREVSPGDLIFSFVDTRIRAIGVARSYCYECPKPAEFGAAGMNWDEIGWRVDVIFREESVPLRPKEHMDILGPLLPNRYAPLRKNGDGLQSIYLTQLPLDFTERLASLMGKHAFDLVRNIGVQSNLQFLIPDSAPKPAMDWEDELIRRIQADPKITQTEKISLVLARRGQGIFKGNVARLETACRLTGVDRPEHLRASHCKPWRDSSNEERLDGENGLLLTPSIDHLFDRGFISFEHTGHLLVSPVVDLESLQRMGVATDKPVNVGSFSTGQRHYLDYHQEHVFLARRFT